MIQNFRITAIFLLFALALLPLSGEVPQASGGVMDLRSWDFSSGGVNLDGEWQFVPDLFTLPGVDSGYGFTEVPRVWQINGGVQGFGTYRIRLRLPENAPPLALRAGYIGWAYRLLADGREVLTVGTPARSLAEETIQAWLGIVPVPGGEEVELLFHVSNFQARKGGIFNSLYLASAEELERGRERQIIGLFFSLGMAFFIGIYYIAFYFFRRKEKYALHFGLFALLLAARAFMLQIDGYKNTFPFLRNWSFELIAKLDYFTNFPLLLGFASFFFLYLQIPRDSWKYLLITRIVTLIYLLGVLVLPYRIYNRYLLLFQVYIMVSVVYLFYRMIGQMRRTGFFRPFFIFSYVILCFCALIDILANLNINILDGFVTFYTGFFVFVFLQSLSINRTFIQAMERVEKLTRQLNELLLEREKTQLVLEEKVAERTLTLQQATREAREASRAKSDFLARMSHEIRTPLNAILGFGQILDMEGLRETSDYPRLIVDESEKLLGLINQLLELSKIDAGKMGLEIRPFRLREELLSLITLFRPQAEKRGLQFREDIPELETVLEGDPLKLRQVLMNLLGNAVKFTPRGEVGLQVYPLRETETEAEFFFSVTDTGIGIPPEKQEEIFQPFVQVDSSIARVYGGTGLGTSIARSLVELMGGRIFLESREGEGSAFYFQVTFPRGRASFPERPSGAEVKIPEGGAGLSVLVVEDYPANRMVLSRYLEMAGCRILPAEDGPEGIRIFREENPDLIFMDLHLPGMNGREAVMKIRQLAGGDTVPIFGLTADAFEETRILCLEAGMDDVLTKPLRWETFLRALMKGLDLLRNRRGQEGARP